MKNCLVQFYMPTDGFADPTFVNIKVNQELLEYSKSSSSIYADKCGADYILIDNPRINHVHPTFERFDLFFNQEWWKEYDQILYLDTDVICWPDAPNVFDMYPDNKKFKICEDRTALNKSARWHKQQEKQTILSQFDSEIVRRRRFNAGVFMLNSYSAGLIAPHLKYKEHSDDDNRILIYAVLASGVEIESMDWRFNKKNGVTSWFGHGYGQEKYKKDNKLLSVARQIFKI